MLLTLKSKQFAKLLFLFVKVIFGIFKTTNQGKMKIIRTFKIIKKFSLKVFYNILQLIRLMIVVDPSL